MSILKKFAAPLIAVAVVATMGVSLLSAPRTAEAGAVVATVAGNVSGNVWNNSTIPTKLPSTIVLTEPGAAAWAAADTITLTHTGLTASGCTATGASVAGCVGGAGTTVITLGAGVTGAVDTISITDMTFAQSLTGAEASFSVTAPGALAIGTITSTRMLLGWALVTTWGNPLNRTAATFSADGAAAGGALCAAAADSAGVLQIGLPITFTVSLGIVSTGTAKSAVALSAANGGVCTNYRGGGGIASTDTAIASNSSNNSVSTLAITLTSPTGNTASKLSITAPTQLAVSPTQTNVSPGYVSTQTQTNFSVQVTDSAGLGVNGQVVLVSTDKGALVSGFGAACGTSKAVTATSATGALTVGGETKAGAIQLTYCGNQTDAAGQATITAQNISVSMANATTTVSTAGRPNKVNATYANGVISATVTDAAGNNVADNTPVLFTISSNAGAVSNTCNLSSNGKASSAVSLNSGSGSVIVSAGYNETGAAATCTVGATGSQSVSTVVNIGTVVTPPPTTTGGATGPGTFAAAPVYSASKLAQAVFNGGTVAQLETAVTGGNGTGVWAQDAKGVFVLYIGNGGFVNDAFKAAFPNGFAGVTAVTVVGK